MSTTTLSSGVFWRSKQKQTSSAVGELYNDIEVYSYYEYEITAATSGVLTPPTNVTIIPDTTPNGEGCIVASAVAVANAEGGLSLSLSATGEIIRGTIDASGNWNLTDSNGTHLSPAIYPVKLIYQGKTTLPNTLDSVAFTKLLALAEINSRVRFKEDNKFYVQTLDGIEHEVAFVA